MDWIRSRWQLQPYKQVEIQDEDSSSDITERVQVRHEFSYAVTFVNLLLTILTITIVLMHRDDSRHHTSNAQSLDCPEPWTDPRYQDPEMNPEIKRVAGYCTSLGAILHMCFL